MDTFIGNRELFRKYAPQEVFDRIVPDADLCGMWARCAAENAERTAVIYDGQEMTYAELDKRIASLRSALADAGCGPKDRVALLCRNSADFLTAFFAIVTAGCAAVALPPQLPDEAVFGCSMMFRVKAVVCHEDTKEKTGLIAQRNPALPILDVNAAGKEPVPAADVSETDPCAVMFTGGTTGKSKGVVLNHRAVMEGIVNGCYGYPQVFNQRYLLVLPLTHVFGLIRNMLTSIYTGSTLYITKSSQDMFRDIAVFRPTILVLVPALAEMALALSKKLGKNMLGDSLHSIICGAAAVPQYLVEEYHQRGITMFPGYGLTESANLVSGNPEPIRKPHSVGIPFPNQELKIVDGELWLRGRNMLDDYIGTEEKAWTEDGWFRTGDLAKIDEDGFLYITGRIKEIIVLDNAENVSPAELEDKFNELSFVQDSQVFEDVGENGKHILALEVVLRATEIGKLGDNAAEKAKEQLWEVNRKLPSAQQVTRIEIRDKDFERSPSMKIIRYKRV